MKSIVMKKANQWNIGIKVINNGLLLMWQSICNVNTILILISNVCENNENLIFNTNNVLMWLLILI